MAVASHCSAPDAQGQSLWSTLSALCNFARERREARGVPRMNSRRSEFATSSSPPTSNQSVPGRTAAFAGPLVVSYPNPNPYQIGGSGGGAGGSSMIGSPAITFAFDPRDQQHGRVSTMGEGRGSFVVMPPHHEVPHSGPPASSGHIIYPSVYTPANQMNFGSHGSSGDQYPVHWADGSSGYQLPPQAVPTMSE
jgi:hypothetical protein